MWWTAHGLRPSPPRPPPGLLDVAATRLIRLVLFAEPQLQCAALARFGLGPQAGRAPANPSLLGVDSLMWKRARQALMVTARQAGPPPSLVTAAREAETNRSARRPSSRYSKV